MAPESGAVEIVDGWRVPVGTWTHEEKHGACDFPAARSQVELALKHCRGQRVVVQAGARIGVWPAVLARYFETVLAFEADPDNYACAVQNLGQMAPIVLRHAALGENRRPVVLARSPQSSGMAYLAPVGDEQLLAPQAVAMVTIDSLELPACDAIFLDVEGYEHLALEGAAETLERFRPVIVAEENALIYRYGRERGDLEKWLGGFGYRLVDEWATAPPELQNDGTFRGSDLIFAI